MLLQCLHSLCEGPLTGAFLSPPWAKKAETPSIIAANESSKPMLAGLVRAELKEATVRGVCNGMTKALHERTEATTRKMRNIITPECMSIAVSSRDCDEMAGGHPTDANLLISRERPAKTPAWRYMFCRSQHRMHSRFPRSRAQGG